MSSGLSIIDLIFVVFGLIFIVSAFIRGFVKEIFSLLNWVIAIAMSYVLTPIISPLFYSYSSSFGIVDIVIKTIIFIFSFIIAAFSTMTIAKTVKELVPAPIDKSLGVFYGIIKTLLIFGLLYSVMLNFYAMLLNSDKEKAVASSPEWLTDSKTYNIIRYSGQILDPIVTSFFKSAYSNFEDLNDDKVKDKIKQGLGDQIEKISQEDYFDQDNDNSSNDNDVNPSDVINNEAIKKVDDTIKNLGYDKIDIEKMNNLIDILRK